MTNYTAVFLRFTRQESRYVNKCKNRNIKAVTEAYKTSALIPCVKIKGTCQIFRLVGYNTYRLSIHSPCR